MSEAAAATIAWNWRDLTISAAAWHPPAGTTPKGVVLLLHGFGASWRHWRHTAPALAAAGFLVHAIDLLGFGGSAKPLSRLAGEEPQPGSVRYGFDLWAEQTVDYLAVHHQLTTLPLHLIGNSIGAVVALNAARLLQSQARPPRQVVLIDCAQRALDNKRLGELPPAQRWGRPILMAALRRRWVTASLFALLARQAPVRQALGQAYPSGAHVDQELLDLLLAPSRDAGAAESFRGFVNLFDDRLAPDLLEELHLPVRMLWGADDPWEPVAEARRWAERYACVRELQVLEGLGHCPHDEGPERVNPILLAWLAQESTAAPA